MIKEKISIGFYFILAGLTLAQFILTLEMIPFIFICILIWAGWDSISDLQEKVERKYD